MIAIVSDIHGNYPALRAVLEDIERKGCKSIFSLGDVAGYYPMINECANALRQKNITNLMGNHDHYLVTGLECPRSFSATRCLEYQRQVVTDENLFWLSQSPLRVSFDEVSLVHGGWNDPLEEYLTQIRKTYFEAFPERVFFSGHTHVQVLVQMESKIYCNPGSVGQPRNGDPRACYAIYNGNGIDIFRVEYDISETANAMAAAGFQEVFYSNLFSGRKIGGDIMEVSIV